MILQSRLKAANSADSIHQQYRTNQLTTVLQAHRHTKQHSQLMQASKPLLHPTGLADEPEVRAQRWTFKHTKKLTSRYQTVDLWKMKHGSQKEQAIVGPLKKYRTSMNNAQENIAVGTPKANNKQGQPPERPSMSTKQQSMTLTRLPKVGRPITNKFDNEEDLHNDQQCCFPEDFQQPMMIRQKELSSTFFKRKLNRKDIVHAEAEVFNERFKRYRQQQPIKITQRYPSLPRESVLHEAPLKKVNEDTFERWSSDQESDHRMDFLRANYNRHHK